MKNYFFLLIIIFFIFSLSSCSSLRKEVQDSISPQSSIPETNPNPTPTPTPTPTPIPTSIPTSSVTTTNIYITGTYWINHYNSENFYLKADYSDGSSRVLTANSWAISPIGTGEISQNGKFTASSLNTNKITAVLNGKEYDHSIFVLKVTSIAVEFLEKGITDYGCIYRTYKISNNGDTTIFNAATAIKARSGSVITDTATAFYANLGDILPGESAISKATDRKSTRLNSSHTDISRMPSSA